MIGGEIIGFLMLFSMLTLIFIGFPIAFTLLFIALAFGYLGIGDRVFALSQYQIIGMMKDEVLTAVPLFIFMGYMSERSGMLERLFKAFQTVFGGLRGSLYVGVILAATIFAMATGIVGAAVAVLGIMAGPMMVKAGYNAPLSAGAIAAGGTLGILIPPSVMLVVMGPVLNVSVLQLYAAAIGPGLLLAGLYIVYTLGRSLLQPELGPAVPREDRVQMTPAVLLDIFLGIVPLGLLITVTVGSILIGAATTTEAAAVGAFGATVLAALYGRLTFKALHEAAMNTMITSAMVLLLAATSNVFGAMFARSGAGMMITTMLLDLQLPSWMVLAVIMALIFLLGWPFEWPAIVLVFLPIFYPVIKAMNINMLWFGALVAVNLQTAFLSPPVAMSAYYLKQVVPQWSLGTIYNGMFQFMVIQVIGLALLMLFPEIALWLPSVLAH